MKKEKILFLIVALIGKIPGMKMKLIVMPQKLKKFVLK